MYISLESSTFVEPRAQAPAARACCSTLGMLCANRPNNHLLEAMPACDWEHLSQHLELVEMPLGQVIYESGDDLHHVYFPTTSIVSLLNLAANGACAEFATVGNDGVVGVPLLMGGVSTNGRAVVQSAGHGYRLNRQVIVDELNAGGAVMQLLLRYTQALLTQVAQTALCNRHHAVEQQVSRLILRDTTTGEPSTLDVTGLFVAIGHDPRTELFKDQITLTEEGTAWVEGRTSRTSLPGVFAAGDVLDPTYRQAITAAGSGCVAALDVEHWLADTLNSEAAKVPTPPTNTAPVPS